jgi:hypothetical protein
VALSTIMWREAWKYGERAFRYCQLDVGHAVAALLYAGAVLGWRLSEQPQIGTATLATVLGLDRQQDFPARRHAETEREEAEILLSLSFDGSNPANVDGPGLKHAARSAQWTGVASTIDAHPMYRWPILDEIATATRVADDIIAPRLDSPSVTDAERIGTASIRPAADVILRRRSAQRFDSRHFIEQDAFFGLLAALTPRGLAHSSVLAGSHRIDLVLLVHRVRGLDSGVYLLNRALDGAASLTTRLGTQFDVKPVAAAPAGLDLRFIASVEAHPLARFARALHCHQEIAAQACFVVAIVAEFDAAIKQGTAAYRALHREAGLLGHVVYLEAELRGLRGTGIGCFFDDMLHDLLKLTDTESQTIYHFAVGKPVDDPRIETETAWPNFLTANLPR